MVGVVAALLGVVVTGCAGTGAPSGWLPNAAATQEEAHGAWISIQHSSEGEAVRTEGELIAVGDDTVFVLATDGTAGSLVAIPTSPDLTAKLGTYSPAIGGIVVWTFLGTVSTVSHGKFLILSAPVWIITGTVVGINQTRGPIERYPGDNPWDAWNELRVFARFPQGLPESVDRAMLAPKRGSRGRNRRRE
jgi:hypothetical protein